MGFIVVSYKDGITDEHKTSVVCEEDLDEYLSGLLLCNVLLGIYKADSLKKVI